MFSEFSIRAVVSNDLPSWRSLWDSYNAFYGRSGKSSLPTVVTSTTWDRFLDPDEPMNALVAEADGALIGFAHYLFHRSTSSLGMSCYLQDLFTAQEQRGRGVGAALIQKVYEQAVAAGCARVYWQTHETNHDAMHLYNKIADRSGFLVFAKQL